jgi:hypothetical protein
MISDTDGFPVTTVEGLEANTLADGFFHAATWVFVLLGILGLLAPGRKGGARRPGGSTSVCCSPAGGSSTSPKAPSTTTCSACTTCATTWGFRRPGTLASWSSERCCWSAAGRCTGPGTDDEGGVAIGPDEGACPQPAVQRHQP